MSTHHWIDIAVQTPAHSQVGGLLSYRSPFLVQPGQLVRVPLGRREVLGVVWAVRDAPPPDMPASAVRDVLGVLEGLVPLDAAWRQLVQFSAQYYQRSLGEVALSALPPQLRDLTSEQLARRLKKQNTERAVHTAPGPALSDEQSAVLAQMASGSGPFLLFGSTALCSSDRAGPGVVCTVRSVFCFLRRRASCSLLRSRSCGGSADKATSPKERW